MLRYYFFESAYNPYPKNKIPMIIARMASIDRNGPTYYSPFLNREASFIAKLLMNIAADMYFAETRIADIRQKITPTPLLFTLNSHFLYI